MVFTINFVIIRSAPGNPVRSIIGKERDDPALQEALMEKWGLNDSLPVQSARQLTTAVQGDLGTSII